MIKTSKEETKVPPWTKFGDVQSHTNNQYQIRNDDAPTPHDLISHDFFQPNWKLTTSPVFFAVGNGVSICCVVPSTVSLIMIIQCAASPSPSASHFPVVDPSLVDQLINPQIASPKSGGADEIVRFFTTSIETNRYCFTTWLISNQAQIYFSFFFQKNMRKIQGIRKKWHEREIN